SRLLVGALNQDPNRPEWLLRRAHQLLLGHWRLSAEEGRERASRALATLEEAVELDPSRRFVTLDNMAQAALSAGGTSKARRYSEELLATATQNKNDWNYGNAVHKGHVILGLLALDAGDVAEAKRQLTLAGQGPGSPQLESFGPNMSLAKALLDRGESEA